MNLHHAPPITTAAEFYGRWETLDTEYCRMGNVTLLVFCVGQFDWRRGEIHRVFPWEKEGLKTLVVGTHRPATQDELNQIDWAIRHGAAELRVEQRGEGLGGVIPPNGLVLIPSNGQPLEVGGQLALF